MSTKKKLDSNRRPKRGSDINQSEPRFLVIGQISKAHGIHGEVSISVLTDFVERFEAMETVLVGDEDSVTLYHVESIRWHTERVLIRFAETPDRDTAESLRGLYLQIPIEEATPLEPDAYYPHQLVGLSVITDEGEILGTLAEILETGANDVYLVRGEKGEILLPATREVVVSVDLTAQQMVVHLIAGLEFYG